MKRGFGEHGGAYKKSRSVEMPGRSGTREGGGGDAHGRRLYVGNLSYEVAWQDLKDHFKQCGSVVRADILEEPGGRSKGCGIVEFALAEEAQLAITTLNDTELKGRPIFVREDREANVSSAAGRRLYGKNLSGSSLIDFSPKLTSPLPIPTFFLSSRQFKL